MGKLSDQVAQLERDKNSAFAKSRKLQEENDDLMGVLAIIEGSYGVDWQQLRYDLAALKATADSDIRHLRIENKRS